MSFNTSLLYRARAPRAKRPKGMAEAMAPPVEVGAAELLDEAARLEAEEVIERDADEAEDEAEPEAEEADEDIEPDAEEADELIDPEALEREAEALEEIDEATEEAEELADWPMYEVLEATVLVLSMTNWPV